MPITISEAREQIRIWKPKNSGYYFGLINIKDLNMYPCREYVHYVNSEYKDLSLEYWKKRIKLDGTVTPIIVEKTKLSEGNKTVDGYFIRDGIHRFSAMELSGKKQIPAIVIEKGYKKLCRDFKPFTEMDLDYLGLESVYKK